MDTQDEYVCYYDDGVSQMEEVGGEYLYSTGDNEGIENTKVNEQRHVMEEVGGEYLYSTGDDKETENSSENEPTEVVNTTAKQNVRQKRPVSRQDSNLYDMAYTDENLYDEVCLNENEGTGKTNMPNTQRNVSKTAEKSSLASSRNQDLERKKPEKKDTERKKGNSITTNCNKRCVSVSLLCLIIAIGVGTGAVYFYTRGTFEFIQQITNKTIQVKYYF